MLAQTSDCWSPKGVYFPLWSCACSINMQFDAIPLTCVWSTDSPGNSCRWLSVWQCTWARQRWSVPCCRASSSPKGCLCSWTLLLYRKVAPLYRPLSNVNQLHLMCLQSTLLLVTRQLYFNLRYAVTSYLKTLDKHLFSHLSPQMCFIVLLLVNP